MKSKTPKRPARKPEFTIGETFRYRGFDVKVTAEYDPDPDFSWLGEFKRKACCDLCVNRKGLDADGNETGTYYYSSGEMEWWHPSGMRGTSPEDIKADHKLHEEFGSGQRSMHVVTVTASRNGVKLGFDSLGGVDDGYIADAVYDYGMISNAIDEARKTLRGLCCKGGA